MKSARAVFDTNIWFRAVISPHGAPAKLLEAYRAGRFTVVASLPLIEELEDILTRPKLVRKYHLPSNVLGLPAYLRRRAELVEIDGGTLGCRDPKDDQFVETALRGGVEYLVSEDKDLHDDRALCERLSRLGIHVMTARSFAMEIGIILSGDHGR